MSFKINCDNCNIEYEINHDSPENVATTYVICPKCKKEIYAASCFGFGPVWPAYMYLGSNLFLIVTFFNDNQYEIKDGSNFKKEIIIPKRYVKGNYKYHFKILEYIHKNIKELVDASDINVE